MIEFSYQAKEGTVFIHCAANNEEKARLGTLISQTKAICRMIGKEGKTGLRIVEEFTLADCVVVIFSINERIELVGNELDLIKQEILLKPK